MALIAEQLYEFGGVDSLSNPLILPPGKFLRCKNWIVTKDRHLQLRWGYTKIPTLVGDEVTYTAPETVSGQVFEVLRPSSSTGTYQNSINAYDGLDTTPSSKEATIRPSGGPGDPGQIAPGTFTQTWFFAAHSGGTPVSVVLKVQSGAATSKPSYRTWTTGPYGQPIFSDPIAGSGTATNIVMYTVDNGSNWTTIYNAETHSALDQISLSTATDTSQVQVKASNHVAGNSIVSVHSIYEIRLEIQS